MHCRRLARPFPTYTCNVEINPTFPAPCHPSTQPSALVAHDNEEGRRQGLDIQISPRRHRQRGEDGTTKQLRDETQ